MNITVENIKCGGCSGSITKKLTAAFDTENVEVNIEQGTITIDIDDTRRDEDKVDVEVKLEVGVVQQFSVSPFKNDEIPKKWFV